MKFKGTYIGARYFDGIGVFVFGRTGHFIEIGKIAVAYVSNGHAYIAQDVYELDVKMDDGVANTGSVYGVNNSSVAVTNNTTNGIGCAGYGTAGSDYALKAQTNTCYILYWMKSM